MNQDSSRQSNDVSSSYSAAQNSRKSQRKHRITIDSVIESMSSSKKISKISSHEKRHHDPSNPNLSELKRLQDAQKLLSKAARSKAVFVTKPEEEGKLTRQKRNVKSRKYYVTKGSNIKTQSDKERHAYRNYMEETKEYRLKQHIVSEKPKSSITESEISSINLKPSINFETYSTPRLKEDTDTKGESSKKLVASRNTATATYQAKSLPASLIQVKLEFPYGSLVQIDGYELDHFIFEKK